MMAFEEISIRSYDMQIDRARIEDLERKCEVGSAKSMFLFTNTMGDPICRIRNSPLYKMLVADLDNEVVGVVQGSIKVVSICSQEKNQASVGYILGLRVSPLHRRKGIGLSLVRRMEEWFITNQVDLAYMATEKDNKASAKLFINKLNFVKFRTPAILVNPVGHRTLRISPNIEIEKLKIEQSELLYRRFMGSTEFFPHDIDRILTNKLSLGTWVAYPRGESLNEFELDQGGPTSWAMVSVWNCGDLFKLRVGNAPRSYLMFAKSLRFIDRLCPCLKVPTLPDIFHQFGFYFMYGVHCKGPKSGKLVCALCRYVHNMATKCKDCKVIATEIGERDTLRLYIPHSRLLSCSEDLWCIKALKNEEKHTLFELVTTPPPITLFVDPREV